jgi:O-antigen/teichoic acid export membrane protein
MIIALFMGAGLATLAAITAIAQTLGQLTMVTLAYRACPGLRVKRSYIHGGTIKELYIYSGKTLLPTISDMLQNQTISVMILDALGPGALAIFTRPRALLRQMDSLERRMAMILVPTASSMEGLDDREAINNLMIKATRYSLYLALPLLFILIFFGGFVMRIWMGPAYALNLVPAILAVGFIGVSVMEPMLSVLVGLNAHGRGGLSMVVASLASVVIGYCLQHYFHAGLVGMACAITGPMLIAHLVYLPWMACRHLGLNLGRFYAHALGEPMLHVLPFAAALAIARVTFRNYPIVAILALVVGGTALGIFYWQRVVPGRLKKWALRFVGRKTNSAQAAA